MPQKPFGPAKHLEQINRERIARVRKGVSLLAALDYANRNPKDAGSFKSGLSEEDRNLIQKAREARKELKTTPCPPQMFSPEEYCEIERRMIVFQRQAMKQSEYQDLVKAYDAHIQAESIKRWETIPIQIVQGGAPQ